MKKYLMILLVGLIVATAAVRADAGFYILGTAGGGGESGSSSYGGEIGAIWPNDEPKYMLGLGASKSTNGSKETATFLLDKVKSDDIEIYGAGGIAVTKGLFVVGTAGATETCEGTVFKGDDASSCASYDDNETSYKFAASGQLRYVYKQLIIGAGYHNRRGIVGGIGIRF